MKSKYIKTKDNEIIVFSELQNHSDFIHFEPVTAGFIYFNTEKITEGGQTWHDIRCSCVGESVSLKMKADTKIDSDLAERQILGKGYF